MALVWYSRHLGALVGRGVGRSQGAQQPRLTVEGLVTLPVM